MYFVEVLVFVSILYFVIRPIYNAFLFTRPLRFRISFFTPTSLGVEYEDISLTSKDGTILDGWYIKSRNGAAVILLHGHSGNRLAMNYHAEALLKAGYGVLAFDLRAHGNSGGKRFARSQCEVDDVLTAVTYISKRPDVTAAGIGIAGVSVGGLLAIQAAAQTVAIRAIWADGASPATMGDMYPPYSLKSRYQLAMQRYYMWLIDLFVKRPSLPNNIDLFAKIAPRPIYFVSTGTAGEQRLVRHYVEHVQEPKTLWEIPDGRHAEGWHAREEEYGRNLVSFFDQNLVHKSSSRVVLPIEEQSTTQTEEQNMTTETTKTADANDEIAYDATIPMSWANMVAFSLFPIGYILFFWPYRQIWGESVLANVIGVDFSDFILILVIFFASILVHEWLHVFGFTRVGKAPKTSVKYGFSWKGLAPYAHCSAQMTTAAYRISVALPGIVLGVIPAILGIVLGVWWLTAWGTLMFAAAGGDLAVLLAIRKVPKDAMVQDHPSKAGCQVLNSADI